MVKALFYKEWAKTKRIFILLSFLFLAFLVYTFINTGQLFRVSGAVEIFSAIIQKDMSILPDRIDQLPLLAGLLLGFAQFVPEMTDKRLKLTLHLPLPESRIITVMLMYGVSALVCLYLVTYAVLVCGLSLYYPSEVISAMLWKSAPWFLAGFAGYLSAAWICLEPVWKQRVFNALISLCAIMLFYIKAKSGSYAPFMPLLFIITAVSFSFPFYSASRFKEGAQ